MRHPAFILAVVLLVLSAAFISYRIIWLGYPLFPTPHVKAWGLSMEARVKPYQKEVVLRIGLPSSHAGQVVEEQITSGSLDFNLLREGPNQIGVWSGSIETEGEIIGYRATILLKPNRPPQTRPPKLEPYPVTVGITEQTLAKRLVARWNQLPSKARLLAISGTAADVWGEPPPDTKDIKAWSEFREKHGQRTVLLVLLHAANLPARTVDGLLLTKSVASIPIRWIEVWTGQEWNKLQPETGMIYHKSVMFLPLTTGGLPPVRVSRGELSEIRWTLSQQIVTQWRVQFERIRLSDHLLDRLSLFSLPPEFQNTFRIFLLVPIGALMICVLRNLIGFPTFGIFMPVLMALAFRSTGLIYGLIIFAGVVLIGYVVRRLIDRLHLLLVPRLSVILTLVIVCFTIVALFGSKFGFREFMAVGLLPFVILTMTIERFFVIMEESGTREGLRTAMGSAAVAAITHEIIHIESLQLAFFVYPELLFAVGALQILLGRYTGYRLSEFIRFRNLKGIS